MGRSVRAEQSKARRALETRQSSPKWALEASQEQDVTLIHGNDRRKPTPDALANEATKARDVLSLELAPLALEKSLDDASEARRTGEQRQSPSKWALEALQERETMPAKFVFAPPPLVQPRCEPSEVPM